MSETFNQKQYEQSTPIVDKFLRSNGTIESADGELVEELSAYNIHRYEQSVPIPDKFLHPDGSIKQMNGNLVEESTGDNKKRYEQATPIPAKFLQMDGTITSHLGKTVEEATMKYKLYAWKLGIMSTTIGYLENENPEVGDILMLPENTGSGPITDTSQLKKGFEITRIINGVIYAKVTETSTEMYFVRDEKNDYLEEIEEILPMPTGLQNGLVVAPRGTVYKAIEIKIE